MDSFCYVNKKTAAFSSPLFLIIGSFNLIL